ncbi:four helix bundle protein [Paracrocinitomix mangrovi]|uniref:four helix bundle protein n=1 Tax=Paracrocinitomix mangrovi TaxID=2862509 RepID=UPI001C8ED92E|nr:four helix bundle protein [Paracrocinitomix mangrovi]UKN01702.1 four helix bundle protein [Paracrocinitomix mangrovi]
MWSSKQKAIMQAKIDARRYSRELIRDVFQTTEHFPQQDTEMIRLNMRQHALNVSTHLSHGSTKGDFEEQNEYFMVVMQELREVLKYITIANHLGMANNQQKLIVRTAITKVINALDDIVLLQQKED